MATNETEARAWKLFESLTHRLCNEKQFATLVTKNEKSTVLCGDMLAAMKTAGPDGDFLRSAASVLRSRQRMWHEDREHSMTEEGQVYEHAMQCMSRWFLIFAPQALESTSCDAVESDRADCATIESAAVPRGHERTDAPFMLGAEVESAMLAWCRAPEIKSAALKAARCAEALHDLYALFVSELRARTGSRRAPTLEETSTLFNFYFVGLDCSPVAKRIAGAGGAFSRASGQQTVRSKKRKASTLRGTVHVEYTCIYTAQENETLGDICKFFDVDAKWVQHINRMKGKASHCSRMRKGSRVITAMKMTSQALKDE